MAGSYDNFSDAVLNLQDGQTLKLYSAVETGADYSVTSPLKLTAQNATLDLNNQEIVATNNFSLVIEGDGTIVKNGNIVSAENTAKRTKINSYVLVVNNCDGVTLESITTTGGVSIGGSQGETPNAGAATNVTIKDCNFTSGDFYALCAQMTSTATVEGGTYQIFDDGEVKGTGVLQGTFTGTDGPSGTITVFDGTFTGIIRKNNNGTIILQGGTYSENPSDFVAEGYEAQASEDKWIVVPVE